MAVNGILNMIGLFYLLIVMPIGFVLVATVYTPLKAQLNTSMTASGMTPKAWTYQALTDYEGIVWGGARYLTWFFIALTVLSSFINGYNYREWLVGSIGSIMACALLTYFGALLWNQFIVLGSGTLDFTLFMSSFSDLVSSFNSILIANLFAALASFVWAKQQPDFRQVAA